MAANVTGGRFRLASPATANVLAVLGAALLLAAVPLTTVNHTLADPRGGAISRSSLPAVLSAWWWPGVSRAIRWGGSCSVLRS